MSGVNVIPAIDIMGGKVVRLKQGKAELKTVYFDSPLEAANKWMVAGAELIHVVDLDGAIGGSFSNLPAIKSLARSVRARIELGGGLRDEGSIEDALGAGIDRVVLGTKALDEAFLSRVVKKFAGRIVAGIDAKGGIVYTKGWLSGSGIKATELAKKVAGLGVKTVIYTDISKDGMLAGPNIKGLEEMLAASGIGVIASGGVSTMDDVRVLKALESKGLEGMIIGKALYDNTLDLGEAIKICSQKG
jgi:phosphoribosylformimino-5-aminoimidazole carboxamide ribotide isomerase